MRNHPLSIGPAPAHTRPQDNVRRPRGRHAMPRGRARPPLMCLSELRVCYGAAQTDVHFAYAMLQRCSSGAVLAELSRRIEIGPPEDRPSGWASGPRWQSQAVNRQMLGHSRGSVVKPVTCAWSPRTLSAWIGGPAPRPGAPLPSWRVGVSVGQRTRRSPLRPRTSARRRRHAQSRHQSV